MGLWKPDLASVRQEELMEKEQVPEEDRDTLRRFAEWLKRRKEFKENGKCAEPPPEGMRSWVLGEDDDAKQTKRVEK